MEQHKESIGVFDSGYGGLTILKEIVRKLPEYNYVYLGDNARAPYGARSFEVVYEYTREAVHKLFEMECLVIRHRQRRCGLYSKWTYRNGIPKNGYWGLSVPA